MSETLSEWVERMEFVDLNDQWICHAKQFTDEPEQLVRLMFISLRQDLQESADKSNGTILMFPNKPPRKPSYDEVVIALKALNKKLFNTGSEPESK
jgi:hypothetical protein